MALDIRNSGDVFKVSTTPQTNATTAATVNKSIEFNEASTIENIDNRENDQTEKTGEVEPTSIEIKDKEAQGTLVQDKATPDAIAWAMRYLVGAPTSTVPGGTVRRHIFEATAYPQEPPYFTAVHRKGGSGGTAADLRQQIGLGMNTVGMSFAKGEFASLNLGVLGTGRFVDSKQHEIVVALDTATSLQITQDILSDVFADSSVIIWCDQDQDGQYETPVNVTAYNAGTKTFTIDTLGGGGANRNYRVSYIIDESETGFGWVDTSGNPVPGEFKLKAANTQIVLGSEYTKPGGVPTFTGGQIAGCEIEALTWEWNWNGEIGKCWRQGSSPEDFATSVDLKDPLQTIELTRRVRDFLLSSNFDQNTPMGLYIDAVGAEIDSTQAGELFHVKFFFPKVGILAMPLQVSDTRWVEAGSLQVLKDTSSDDWPTVICQVQNEVTSYA